MHTHTFSNYILPTPTDVETDSRERRDRVIDSCDSHNRLKAYISGEATLMQPTDLLFLAFVNQKFINILTQCFSLK